LRLGEFIVGQGTQRQNPWDSTSVSCFWYSIPWVCV